MINIKERWKRYAQKRKKLVMKYMENTKRAKDGQNKTVEEMQILDKNKKKNGVNTVKI